MVLLVVSDMVSDAVGVGAGVTVALDEAVMGTDRVGDTVADADVDALVVTRYVDEGVGGGVTVAVWLCDVEVEILDRDNDAENVLVEDVVTEHDTDREVVSVFGATTDRVGVGESDTLGDQEDVALPEMLVDGVSLESAALVALGVMVTLADTVPDAVRFDDTLEDMVTLDDTVALGDALDDTLLDPVTLDDTLLDAVTLDDTLLDPVTLDDTLLDPVTLDDVEQVDDWSLVDVSEAEMSPLNESDDVAVGVMFKLCNGGTIRAVVKSQ